MANNNNKDKCNVPHLRFPEFSGEWKAETIVDACTLYNGRAYKQEELLPIGKYRVLRVGNFFTNDSWYYSDLELDEQKTIVEGDLLYAWSASFGPRFWTGEKAIYHYHIWKVIPKEHIDKDYLYHFLYKDSLIIKSRTQGGTMVHVTKGDMEKRPISFPCLEEQRKIAKLLSLLDERIVTQNKIIEKLQSLIKGLVDSLLENPSWEKVYLRSFMQFYSTNSLSWEQLSYSNGNVRNLHYGLIHGFQTSMIDSTLLPRILPNYLPKQYTVCLDGDVAFADASEDTNEIGKAIEFSNTIDVKTVCGLHTIHGRDIKQNTILGFKGFAFNSRYFHDQVRRLAQGTKVYSITAKNLSSCYVYIPDMIKQENVVRLLNAYEENLSLNRTLLNKYEIQKQYLLQQILI